MRLYLVIASEGQKVPYEHQHLMVGCVHKWLGWNNQHGELSFFSFSRLSGGKGIENGLLFERYATFFISAFDINIIKQLIKGIRKDPSMFCGLTVNDISVEDDPDLSCKERFLLGSPILIQRRFDDKIVHILYDDIRSSQCLKETLLTKMKKVGLEDESFDVFFDTTYSKAKIMLINYRGIQNKVSLCPVIIKGSQEVKNFIWNVGLGNSTGIGFGAIK